MGLLDHQQGTAQRQRLIEHAEAYLRALHSHTPENVHTSPDARLTENTCQAALGTGLWRTLVSNEPGGQFFVDVESGQVAHWGLATEIAGPSLVGHRLKICGSLVTEVETLALRGSSSNFFSPDTAIGASQDTHDVVPPQERSSRAELIEIADSYFDAIEQDNGDIIPVAPDCRRFVNGITDSTMDAADLDVTRKHLTLGIQQQLDEGHYNYIERIRDRRYSIVDVERGLVHCQVVFDHPGYITRPSGERPFGSPSSMLFFEVFKIRNCRLSQVLAIGSNALPYGIRSGWNLAP